MNQEREETDLVFEEVVTVKNERNPWFGNLHHFSSHQTCQFDDINLFRLMGKDTIHLERVILTNHDNVIILRKMVGTTRIIVPVDVEISLSVNCLYGDLTFLHQPKKSLRNEHYHQETRDYLKSNKSVKIFPNYYGWRCGGGQRMKKQSYLLIGLTSFLVILFLTNSLLDILNLDWSYLLQDIEKAEKLIFLTLVFSLSMTFFFVLFWRVIEEVSRRKMQINLKRLLAGKRWLHLQIRTWMPVSNPCLASSTS